MQPFLSYHKFKNEVFEIIETNISYQNYSLLGCDIVQFGMIDTNILEEHTAFILRITE